jgi:hypothetical protein
MATRKMFDDDDTGEYNAGGGEMSTSPTGQNEGGNAGQEEEFKGTVDFDKVPVEQKNFIPTIYDDENYEFKVIKP